MSPNIALALWWGVLAAIVCAALAACYAAGAVELSIIGHSSGQGLQVLNFSGDNITAVWDGTAWNITAVVN